MALPKFLYDDPSKHVDFIRRKRKEHKERSSGSKSERSKHALDKLFKKDNKSE